MTLIRAFVRNLRTGSVMIGEKAQVETTPTRPKVPMQRSGAHCFVVVEKQGNTSGAKGAGHPRRDGGNGKPEELCRDGRRQPSLGGTSRISREAYVRFCEGLWVQSPGPTRRWETGRRFGVSARAHPRLYSQAVPGGSRTSSVRYRRLSTPIARFTFAGSIVGMAPSHSRRRGARQSGRRE